MCKNNISALLALTVVVTVVHADIGMHNPRGSNNKLNEQHVIFFPFFCRDPSLHTSNIHGVLASSRAPRSNNVNNDNRLFDSQTNAASGYQVGDACQPTCQPDSNNDNYDPTEKGAGKGTMKFHAGSLLNVEWTTQHGCGASNPDLVCDVVIQYACEDTMPGVRDGSRRATIGGGQNDNGGNTNPASERPNPNPEKQGPEYGMHETYDYYMRCRARERNKGLYTADQLNPTTTRQTAVYTRQDRNAQRYGFECPEERDYYPYWHPTPWRDVAVLTDEPGRCAFYERESQNVAPKGRCVLTPAYVCSEKKPCVDQKYNENNPPYDTKPVPNNPTACAAWEHTHKGEKGKWEETGPPEEGDDAPECLPAPWSRTNHLGNGKDGRMASYTWKIPDLDAVVGKKCVLRIRYNTTSKDLDWFADKKSNGKIKGDPVKDFIGGGVEKTGNLRLNINTDQYFRTFEDRSHVFEITPKAEGIPWYAEVFNFNARQDFAEHFVRSRTLHCTAMARVLISAECSAIS